MKSFKKYVVDDVKDIMAELEKHKDYNKVKVSVELGGMISITYKKKQYYITAFVSTSKKITYIHNDERYDLNSLMKMITK